MNKTKLGLTSVEAAALWLSDGKTKDPEQAALIDQGQEFDMDGLTRAALRRAMGFDFKVKQAPNYFHVYSDDDLHVSARAKILPHEVDVYGNIINADATDRLAEACLRLKTKWDAAKKKASAA